MSSAEESSAENMIDEILGRNDVSRVVRNKLMVLKGLVHTDHMTIQDLREELAAIEYVMNNYND